MPALPARFPLSCDIRSMKNVSPMNDRKSLLACCCSCCLFVLPLLASDQPKKIEPDPRVVEAAKRTGYAPVVPFPAEDTVDPAGRPPSWLEVRPFPIVDGKPIVSRSVYHSQTLGLDVGYNIFLPPGYDADMSRRFPVVYWLHGRNNNEYTNIAQASFAHEAILKGQLEPLIIIFGNGLGQAFYLDSVDGRYPAETLIIKELIPHIDGKYRTQASRTGRHIAGMSMGGFGCLRLAFKYPQLFASVVSYAGVFSPEGAAANERNVVKVTGGDRKRFVSESPQALLEKNADQIRDRLAIRIICGSRDRFLQDAREMNQQLARLKIDHDYEELSPFGHDIDGMFARAGVEGLQFALTAGVMARKQSVEFDVNTNVPIGAVRIIDPVYPESAKQAKVEGRIALEARIALDGTVKEVRTVSGDSRLADPTADIVKRWKFDAPKVDGKPAEITIGVEVRFRLGE